MPYYSYIWLKKPDSSGNAYNYLVVSPDSNTADTLFRALDENKSLAQDAYRTVNVKELYRESSQIWTYDCVDHDLPSLLSLTASGNFPGVDSKEPALRDVLEKIKIIPMSFITTVGQDLNRWKMLPGLHLGVDNDCLSGYSFYVRRRGFPEVYWYNDDDDDDDDVISLSRYKRSRFIVTVQTKLQSPKIPIIARDTVKVELVDQDSTRRSLDVSDGFLALSLGEPKLFHFSDFLQRFSIAWSDFSDRGDPYLGSKITWSSASGNGNDSFELCEGVPVGELGDMSDN
jgi:hypothetical protein